MIAGFVIILTVKPVLSSHSKIDKTKILMTNGSIMKAKVLQNATLGAFCNTFDLHSAIISLENQFLVFLRVAVLDRFYCITMCYKLINGQFKGDDNTCVWSNEFFPILHLTTLSYILP